eukprot:gene5497-6660_t
MHFPIPSSWSHDQVLEAAKALEPSLAEKHKHNCKWMNVCCPDAVCEFPKQQPSILLASFKDLHLAALELAVGVPAPDLSLTIAGGKLSGSAPLTPVFGFGGSASTNGLFGSSTRKRGHTESALPPGRDAEVDDGLAVASPAGKRPALRCGADVQDRVA